MHAPEAGSLFRGGTSRNFGILAKFRAYFQLSSLIQTILLAPELTFVSPGSAFLPIAVRKGRGLYRQ